MQRTLKSVLCWSFTALCLSQAVGMGSAQAAFSCKAGSLCFRDIDDNFNLGKVSGNNTGWSAFSWNDKADDFQNSGSTHNVCIYIDSNYRGSSRLIKRGEYFYNASWEDRVSSNQWTKGTSCPVAT